MALELRGIEQSFGRQRALDGVSLSVEPGRIVAFLGHNGAGKTTAMRIALGLVRPDAGTVVVDGFDARLYTREARARTGALIESPGFHGTWSASANLAALARLAGADAARARAESARVLEQVGLGGAAEQPVETFSQGMRQRLGIAQALLGRPRYLLLDEPQNGLDPEGVADLRTLLVHLAREERLGILVSSHQLAELAGFATHVVILRRGVVVHAGAMDAVFAREGRWRMVVRDAARARSVLERAGARFTEAPAAEAGATELSVELGARSPEPLALELLQAGAGLVALAEVVPTLEEIYLRSQTAPGKAAASRAPAEAAPQRSGPPADLQAPAELQAPAGPVRAATRYELTRLFARGRLAWLLAVPLAVASIALWKRVHAAGADARAVEGQAVFSTTDVTAFEGVGVALTAGLPLLALCLAGVASQSLAGELARGTLRNVLLRPVERGQVVLGKALALLCTTVVAWCALVGLAVGASAALLAFGDVAEILPNGGRFVLTTAAELRPDLVRALSMPLAALSAATLIGFACGALVRSASAALGLSFAVVVGLDLARLFVRGGMLEGWLPGAHLASPLGDASVLGYYLDRTRGVSSAHFRFEDAALWAPLAWMLLSLTVARAMLVRRQVP